MRRMRVLDSALARIGWGVPSGMVVLVLLLVHDIRRGLLSEVPPGFVGLTQAAFVISLLLLFVRLALNASTTHRVMESCLLAGSMISYAIGVGITSLSSNAGDVKFPGYGEYFFFFAYVLLAMFMFSDTPRIGLPSTPLLLEAAMVAGGTLCLGGLMVVSPVAHDLSGHSLAALAAVFYPLLDLLLVAMLIGQVAIGTRDLDLRTRRLLLALGLMFIGDVSLIQDLSRGTYNFGILAGVTWVFAHLLLVAVARDPASPSPRPRSRRRELNRLAVVGSVSAALVLLAAIPTGPVRDLLVLPAVLTIGLGGWRVAESLRLARTTAEVQQLARSDDLTDLPNRRAVVDRLRELAAEGVIADRALLLLDLDGFKDFNDSLGHSTGDQVLQIVANKLAQFGEPVEMAARLGDDEFALIVVADSEEVAATVKLARRVRAAVAAPITIDRSLRRVDCALGIVFGAQAFGANDLLRRADVAIGLAKQVQNGSRVVVYEPTRDHTVMRFRQVEELRVGIETQQIVMWYQPKVDADTKALVGMEALARWAHPSEGLKSPADLLPIARHSGLMPKLTEAVISTALCDLRRWRAAGTATQVAINVPPTELLTGRARNALIQGLRTNGIPGEMVMVEVTEDSFLAEPVRAREAIEELRSDGIAVAIDDYGTGYSSLSYLRDLPVEELKIDRTFVDRVISDRASRMIVETTVKLAHELGLQVVAEGVETTDVAERLKDLDVDILQGYLISRPMPATLVPGWIRQHAHDGSSRARGSSHGEGFTEGVR